MGRWIPTLMLVALCPAVPSCRAQTPAPAPAAAADTQPVYTKDWPLRLHILAVDDTHPTARLQPQWSSGSIPDISTGEISAPSNEGSGTFGGNDDFSGSGRADLVTPPDGTVGLNFTYEGCSRIRIPPGFQGLEARWIKSGSRLEVMIPTDAVKDGPPPMQRCTLKLTTQPFVYLRLPNGALVRVTQEAYNSKPALRIFLSGGTETLRRRSTRPSEATPHPQG